MGASIFFSRDVTAEKPEDGIISTYVNGTYWDAFGDLIDAVFLPHYPKLHEVIMPEEGKYIKFYSFAELDAQDFNLAIRLIRDYIKKQENPNEWQKMAQDVWNELAEPYVIQDDRYQKD